MRAYSPWTKEEVENLNKRQKLENVHPYICERGEILVATITGWKCSKCGSRQNWAHSSDLEGRLL
jgi:transcription initiation factor IIE alpha subunit